MPNVERYGQIHYYKNVISNPNELIDLIEKSDAKSTKNTSVTKWQEWHASGHPPYIFGYQKRLFDHNIDQELDPDFKYINKTISKAITESSLSYANDYNIDIGSLMPISISKYLTGKSMGPHVDDYGNGDNPNISVVLYLNNNYEGGGLYFKEQNIKIKPEPGSIVIFPSVEPYYHESLPIESGVKYMCPGFWRKTNKVV